MRRHFKINKLRQTNGNNIPTLLQEMTLSHIENILHTRPSEYYQHVKTNGIANTKDPLYCNIYLELSDWLNTTPGMIEFLTDMNLLSELETVLSETVSFYGVNYLVRAVESFNIDEYNPVVRIIRREYDKYTYLIEIVTRN